MTQRAASCTVDVNCFVYTFINRPNTDFIDYIKFKDDEPKSVEAGKEPVTGKIGTTDKNGKRPIQCSTGPLSCTKIQNEDKSYDIRLYYVFDNKLREAKLAKVGPGSDLNFGWVATERPTDDKLNITSGLSTPQRAIDQTSYLSSGMTVPSKEKKEPAAPYVIFQASGQPEFINYARASGPAGKQSWDVGSLAVKLLPAQSS
jgi:hypothetical protein